MRYILRQGSPNFMGAIQALRIVQLIDTWAPTSAVAEEAQKDPSLAESIVRLAASPLYGRAEPRSLVSAVEFLGYEELRRAMLTLAISAWAPDRDSAAFDMVAFRRRAVTNAYLSEAVARHLKLNHPTKFFLAGMFADVGYMFLAMHTPFAIRHIVLNHQRTPGISLQEAEFYSVGFTHGELSAVAAHEFGFEREVVEAIQYHEFPSDSPNHCRVVADVVHVASGVLDEAGIRPASVLPPAIIDEEALKRLQTTEESVIAQLDGVFERSTQVMGAVRATLAA